MKHPASIHMRNMRKHTNALNIEEMDLVKDPPITIGATSTFTRLHQIAMRFLPYVYSLVVLLVIGGAFYRAYGYTVSSRLKVHSVSNQYLRTLIATYELKDQAQKLKVPGKQFTRREIADLLTAAQFAADELKALKLAGEKDVYSKADVQGLYTQYTALVQSTIDELDEVGRNQRDDTVRRDASVARLILGVHENDALKRLKSI